jgi:ParB-like chromosome segregation protein Spo0J
MAEQLTQLEIIDDNPYQDRGSYEDIAELGRSIAVNGLEQKPKARLVGKRYQLKFGHRRKRAFEWLSENFKKEGLPDRYNGYTVMPLEVEEISDKEMFDGVVIENVHRDDLKVTEKARLLRRYKEVHPEATSEQIGLVFNMNAATVRGMDIFLDLPKEAQTKLDDGTISQGAARLLHSMQKIAPREKVIETLKLIEREKGSTLPEEVIDGEIDRLPNTVDMWNSNHSNGKPRAGYRGWLLDMKNFPNRLLPAMNEQIVGAFEAHLDHLIDPPACTACPFYTKVRGSHYCGMKVCHQRKTVAWELYAVEQASKNTKIAVYTEEDGTYLALGYDTSHLFEKRHKDLRLIPRSAVNGYSYQNFKGFDDDLVMVVATGEELLAKMARSTGTSGGARGGKKTEKEKAEMRAMKVYRVKRLELMWAYTAAAQSIFEGAPLGVLNKINEWNHIGIDDRIPEQYDHPQTGDAAQKLSFQRRALVWRLIMNKTSHYSRSGLVDALQKFADVTGVKAPKTLVKLAEEWDAEIKAVASVSAETKGKKK